MKTEKVVSVEIKRTSSGSIDIAYYDERARQLRSNAVGSFIDKVFKRSKTHVLREFKSSVT